MAITPQLMGAGAGAALGGTLAYLLSKKNKARNTLLAILGGGLAGSAAGTGYQKWVKPKMLEREMAADLEEYKDTGIQQPGNLDVEIAEAEADAEKLGPLGFLHRTATLGYGG